MTPPLPVLKLPFGVRHELPDARRSSAEEIERHVRAAATNPVVSALVDAVDAVLLVLGPRREIVAHNGKALDLAAAREVVGLRPGEAVRCANALPNGCATSKACETCGALGSILRSRAEQRPVEAECLIRRDDGNALEVVVRSTPVELAGVPLTVMSLRDVSAEKRRDAYEQIFFHDVMNTVSGLRGWSARLLRGADPERARAAAERIDVLSRRIEREIHDQRMLAQAERGTLQPVPRTVEAAKVLADLQDVLDSLPWADQRRIEVLAAPEGARLHTDPALLQRVLLNMGKNALEATLEGGTVRVACERDAGALRLSVWNDGVIPPEVQARIFQRSFSTKAARGRGLGTYSMKLLGERHLGGEVDFLSTVEDGTSFWITLPAAG